MNMTCILLIFCCCNKQFLLYFLYFLIFLGLFFILMIRNFVSIRRRTVVRNGFLANNKMLYLLNRKRYGYEISHGVSWRVFQMISRRWVPYCIKGIVGSLLKFETSYMCNFHIPKGYRIISTRNPFRTTVRLRLFERKAVFKEFICDLGFYEPHWMRLHSKHTGRS